MRHFSAGNVGEVIAIALDTGDDILESIKDVIRERKITNGVLVSGIGSLAKARYHIVEPGDTLPWKDVFIEKEGTIEVTSIQGVIADGQPHLHITMSQNDESYGGHLEPGCKVLTLSEIIIMRLEKPMTRIVNEKGLGRLHLAE